MSLKKYLLASIIILAVLATGSFVWLYEIEHPLNPKSATIRHNQPLVKNLQTTLMITVMSTVMILSNTRPHQK